LTFIFLGTHDFPAECRLQEESSSFRSQLVGLDGDQGDFLYSSGIYEAFRMKNPGLGGYAQSLAVPYLAEGNMNFSSRVLLVEDGPINQEVGRAMLENFGCRVEIASNGLEALRLIEFDRFDLILMDCQMPEMDGWEATRKIRECEKGQQHRTPVIAMTAYTLDEEMQRCRDAGMDDYLAKPFSLRDLSGILTRWLVPAEKNDSDHGGQIRTAVPGAELVSIDNATPSIDVEVLKNLRQILGHAGTSTLQSIIEIYLTDSASLVEDLRRSLQSEAPESLGIAAHTLKSSSANLGANVLAGLCREAEALARSKSTLGAVKLVGRIEEEYAKVQHALRAFLKKGE